MIQMRSFRRRTASHCTIINSIWFACHTEIFNIIWCNPDSPFLHACTVIPDITGSHNIATSIIIKEKRSINSRNIRHPVRFGPRTYRILGSTDIVSLICKVCINNIISSIIVTNCWCHKAANTTISFHMKSVLFS